MTDTLLITVVLTAVALVLLARLLRYVLLQRESTKPWPFYSRKLLSEPEQVLYHRLVRALPENIVLAQVQVSRVLGVKKGASFHEWNNRINRLSYDFVICAKDSRPIAAIELDDSSHDRDSRKATDSKKDKATIDAGLHMIRWKVQGLPSEDAIRHALATLELSPQRREPKLNPSATREA